ncbi:hypothetical protein PybrP1_004281 [[Pythium] brassicae (nom. inval.)]|nr:hypothetical protein PybrP1_004281 [[Pythium] brassicae (nom. inval.)]
MSDAFRGVFHAAAACGHVQLLEWIHMKYPHADWAGVIDSAVKNRQFDAAVWIRAYHPESATHDTIAAAASSGVVALLKWLSEQYPSRAFCTSSRKAMKRGAASGSLEVVEFLVERTMETASVKWAPPKALVNAAKNGHLDVLQYLARRLPKKYLRGAVDAAVEHCQLAVLEWLDKRNRVRVSPSTLSRVAQNGHKEILKWLYERSPRYYKNCFGFGNLNLLRDATAHGRGELVQWMLDVGKDIKVCIEPAIDGTLIPVQSAVGDKVLLPEYGGSLIKLGSDEFHLFRDEDILGKLQ